jgi:hypothetical protein
MGEYGLGWSGSEDGQVACTGKCGNEQSVSVKCR